ncbi:MAG: nucleoside phosphorylase [Candidatus Micrarchaeia archaeon]
MQKINFPKAGIYKYRFKPLYNPVDFVKQEGVLKSMGFTKAIFIYSDKLARAFAAQYGASRRNRVSKKARIKDVILYSSRALKNTIIARLAIGAPFTAVTEDELWAMGIKEFLILGSAGGIYKDLEIGDIVICTKALRDEGVSHHYIKDSKYVEPDTRLVHSLEKELNRNRLKFVKGPTWTIDAPYMESVEEVERYSKEGIFTVEMEAAALFAVAKRRGIRAAAVFGISDTLTNGAWSGFSKNYHRKKNSFANLVRIGKIFSELK